MKGYIKSKMPKWLMWIYIKFSLTKRRILKPVVIRKLKKLLKNDIVSAQNGFFYKNITDSKQISDKIPIWICWWQGINNAPKVVKTCVDSIIKNMSSDKVEIHIITIDNLADYIVLPDFIMDKYHRGIIDYTHLSDVVRAALLFKYGGMWIDSTYFMAKKINIEEITKFNFWTQWNSKIENMDFVTHGKWSCNLMYSEPGNIIPAFILSCWYSYWKQMNRLIDYQMLDYIIRIGFEEVPKIKQLILDCPQSEPDILELHRVMNKEFNKERWDSLLENTNFFKLSYKGDYDLKTPHKKMTFWGYIVKNETL